jgi:hypothetical protein
VPFAEGKVVSWLKSVGDRVKKGEVRKPEWVGVGESSMPRSLASFDQPGCNRQLRIVEVEEWMSKHIGSSPVHAVPKQQQIRSSPFSVALRSVRAVKISCPSTELCQGPACNLFATSC